MQGAREQLRRAAQATQRIFDLMRELADHEATAVEARQQIALARDALPLRRVGKFEQQMSSGDCPFERRNRDVKDARIACGAGGFQLQFAIRDALARVEHAAQGRKQPVRLVQKVAEGAAARLLQTEGEHVLSRHVGIDRA